MKKKSFAKDIIKKIQTSTLEEVARFFQVEQKDLTFFERGFLQKMAKDGHLSSKELGIDTIVAYRKALLKKQKSITR